MRQNGGRGAKEYRQRLQENLTQNADDQAGGQCGYKAGGSHLGGLVVILFPQLPGDEVAAALAEKEANGLNDRHHGEHHANRAGGSVAFQHSNEIGVRHIIKGRHQHTHDAGGSQTANERLYRGCCHFYILFFLRIHCILSFLFYVRSSIAPQGNCCQAEHIPHGWSHIPFAVSTTSACFFCPDCLFFFSADRYPPAMRQSAKAPPRFSPRGGAFWAAVPLRTVYRYDSARTSPVRYRSKIGLHAPSVVDCPD